MRLVADQCGKFVDDVGIAQVFLLRGHRQDEVMPYQPGDRAGFIGAEPVFEAKRLRVDRTELRMIAATALGNIVKQSGQVDDLGFFEGLHQWAAMRMFVIESLQRETAQITDDKQGVLIDGVGVKQVVLHTTDDSAEGRDVQAQYAVQVHASQFMRHAGRRTQDREEDPVVSRVLPKLLIDQVQVPSNESNRVRADATKVIVLLQEQK